MNSRKSRMTLHLVGMGIAVICSASGAIAGGLPKDTCALLKPAEIQTLAPNAKIGGGVLDASMAPLGVGCTFAWGPRTREWGESAVTITVIDTSKAYPGVGADDLQKGLLARLKTEAPNASRIPSVGDAAVFSFEARSSNASAEAYLKAKGVHLSVKFHSGDSLAKKDEIVALLKIAAARL